MEGLPRRRLVPSQAEQGVQPKSPGLYTGMAKRQILGDDQFRAQYEQLTVANRLAWVQLCGMSPLPAGRFVTALFGDALDNVAGAYTVLYRNVCANPVGVAIYAAIATLGAQVKIGIGNDPGDSQVVDYLGNTPGAPSYNKRISSTVVLNPAESLYIALAGDLQLPPIPGNLYAFPTTSDDRFNIRVFDPAIYMPDVSWETRS
jgi:hypothetical protein